MSKISGSGVVVPLPVLANAQGGAALELKPSSEQFSDREQYLCELLDSLPAAIYMTDAQGRITYYNQAAVALSGRTPEIGSDKWCVTWRLFRPDGTVLPHDECPMAIALKEGRPIRGVEAVAERPDGTRVPFIPYPTPLHDSAGRIVGAVNMLVDISDRKQSESQKQMLLDELNHRVKNKVQMLHSLVRIEMEKTDSGEVRSVLAGLARRVAAIAAAQRVLYDARHPYSVDMKALVRSVCDDARHSLGNEGRIVAEADAGYLPNDAAIPVALLLNELLTNAMKYGAGPDGKVLVRVTLEKSADSYVLKVEDEGVGFEFSQARSHSAGLGLVAGLARQLGGTFEVERAVGARCVVKIPRGEETKNTLPSDPERRRPVAFPCDESEADRKPAEPVRVLVVEDEYIISARIETALTEAGLRVVGVAATAKDAVAMAAKAQPAIAIVDVRLDGARDGIEVALALYRNFGIRSLIATAHYGSETVARAEPASPLGWLPKPYTMETLILKVGSALERIDAGCLGSGIPKPIRTP